MVSHHSGGYTSLPTSDVASGSSSSNTSASSSLTSSPRQQPIATLHDGEYDEKHSSFSLPSHHSHSQSPRYAKTQGTVGLLFGWMQRGKTVLIVALGLFVLMILLLRDNTSPAPVATNTTTPAKSVSDAVKGDVPNEEKEYRLEDDLVLITKVGSATLHSRLLIHRLG